MPDKIPAFIEKQYLTIDSFDFNDLVKHHFGKEYEFEADVEAANGSCYTFTIREGDSNDEYRQKELQNWLDGQYPPFLIYSLLTAMYERGIIKADNYLINVSW